MVRRSGPSGRPGSNGPVFKEIIWLQRWPKLISVGFILLILLEIIVFVWVADRIGLGLTLLAVVGSAFVGLWLIRRTGLDMVGKLRLTLAQGHEPGHSLVDGACFVLAGLLLILPGFFSDLMAVLLMLPMSRNWLIRRFAGKIAPGYTGGMRTTTVITDVDFREVQSADQQAAEPAPAIPDAVVFETAPAPGPGNDAAGGDTAGGEDRQSPVEPEIWVPQRRSDVAERPDLAPDTPADEPSAAVAEGTGEASKTAEQPARARPGVLPADDDDRWGRAPRRPIIDIEES
jgi:UPF0716 protein FxsA